MGRARTRNLVLTAAAGAAIAMLAASPAGSTVVERGHYSEPYSFSYADCGFDVDVEGTAAGHFRIRAGKGTRSTAFYVNDNYSYTEIHTNAETGAFFTLTGNAVFNEIKAIPRGGNLFEFEAVEAGQPFRLYDSAGNLVVRDRGSIHFHALFDTLGDDDPGGEFVADLGADVHGPHPGFETDFCEIITPLIGP
jgi:hypothetical protein